MKQKTKLKQKFKYLSMPINILSRDVCVCAVVRLCTIVEMKLEYGCATFKPKNVGSVYKIKMLILKTKPRTISVRQNYLKNDKQPVFRFFIIRIKMGS